MDDFNWNDFFIQNRQLPANDNRYKGQQNPNVPFCLHIKLIDNLPLPQVEDYKSIHYHVRGSFYDSSYNQFVGNTWHGPELIGIQSTDSSVRLSYNQSVYFHSSINDPNFMAVLEIVAVVTFAKGRRQQAISRGWTILRMFDPTQDLHDTKSSAAIDYKKLKVYHGTPRALLHMQEPIEVNSFLEPIEDCLIKYSLRTHSLAQKVLYLMPENVMFCGDDLIPGLQLLPVKANEVPDLLKKPKLCRSLPCAIDKLSIMFHPSIEKFEEYLCGLLNGDRISKLKTSPDGRSVTIHERKLLVGIHNGWTYVSEPQVIFLQPDVSQQSTGRSGRRNSFVNSYNVGGNGNSLVSRSKIELPDMVDSDMYAVIFQLEYTILEPAPVQTAKQTAQYQKSYAVALRWSSWCPTTRKSNQVSVAMIGGRYPNPNNTLVMAKVDSRHSDITEIGIGKIQFTFIDNSKPITKGSPGRSLQRSYSVQSPSDSQTSAPDVQGHYLSHPAIHFSSKSPMGKPPIPKEAKSHASKSSPNLAPQQDQDVVEQRMSQIGNLAEEETRERTQTAELPRSPELVQVPTAQGQDFPILATESGSRMQQSTLSRAAYARLYAAGFTDIKDRLGQPPIPVSVGDQIRFDASLEEHDQLKCNDIVFQFLAFTKSRYSHFFFSFQFYRFPAVISERLRAVAESRGSNVGDPLSIPCIFRKLNKDGTISDEPPGYQLSFSVDPAYMQPDEYRTCTRYLRDHTLHIDVWDADSLLLIGSASLSLKNLVRQGRDAVQMNVELDVISTEYDRESPIMTGDLSRVGSVRPVGTRVKLRGRLYMKIANVGSESDVNKAKRGIEPIPKAKVIASISSKGGEVRNETAGSKQRLIRTAKLLSDSNMELSSVLLTRKAKTLHDPSDAAKENDSTRDRKMARMEAVRRAMVGSPASSTIRLVQNEEKINRLRDMRTIEKFRETSKHEGITNILYDAITSRHVIHPSFGSAEFFEFSLKNPYDKEQNILIKCEDPDLKVITSTREWRHFKSIYEVRTPLEDNMFNEDNVGQYPEIFLKTSEVVNVPFRFQSFRADHLAKDQENASVVKPPSQSVVEFKQQLGRLSCIQPRTIKVYFITQSKENPIAILALHVEPQPHIIDQTFRFYHPENSFFKRSIRLPPWRTGGSFVTNADDQQQLYVRCSDPNVVCDSKPTYPGEPQDIYLKAACNQSPSVKRFYLLLFADNYLSQPIQTWQFFIHAQQRIDISATEGQTTTQSLILRGTPSSRLIKCYSSHPSELQITPADQFMLMANSVHELKVVVSPKAPGHRIMYINVVDIEYHQLVHSWLVCLAVRLPVISKAFEINIGSGRSSNKRISYTNPYPMRKIFHLKCNREDILQFRENVLQVDGGSSQMIGLKFLPHDQRGVTEIFIFINDEDDKNEETFCVKVNYS